MKKEQELEYYRTNIVPKYKKLIGASWYKCKVCGLMKPNYDFPNNSKICISCSTSIYKELLNENRTRN